MFETNRQPRTYNNENNDISITEKKEKVCLIDFINI